MFDLDYGECFLNFRQSPQLRPYSGVSLRPFAKELKRDFPELMKSGTQSLWVRWDRMFMGGKLSPYAVIKQLHWLEEAACGDPSDPKNPYRYDKVILNLPGSAAFDPSRSSVIKWDSLDECVACSVVTYSDDGRGAGSSANKAFLARDKLAKGIQSRGAQDAARKASFPSKTPPAWIGGCVNVTRDAITVSVPQEKWEKMKAHIQFYADALKAAGNDRPLLDFKPLEKKLGFLTHVALTYRDFRPFLRGFYLTLNSWRPGFVDWAANDDVDIDETTGELFACRLPQEQQGTSPPCAPLSGQVRAARRFAADVEALSLLTSRQTPTIRHVRHRRTRLLFYAFTDASGTGGGASFVKAHHGSNLSYRVSVWTAEEQKESSNWREFTKVVDAVEDEAKLGELQESLVFLFTDNSTVEAAIHSGSSKSPRLHALVVRFLTLQMQFDFSIEVYHVAGTRMIAQGTDGISRGALNEGVMDGKPMISFIPLHLCPLARSTTLKPWLLTWLPGSPVFLEPKDWFLRGHGITGFTMNTDGVQVPTFAQTSVLVWTPPPYAADIAIAELRKSVHKRANHTHIFICPRLCLPRWRRHFHRACDVVLDIPAGTLLGNYEAPPACSSWKGVCDVCAKTTEWTRALFCANFAPHASDSSTCQRTWCAACYTSSPTPRFHVAGPAEGLMEGDEDIEDRILSGYTVAPVDQSAFMVAREGDDLLCQFECDFCIFRKLYHRPPVLESPSDELSLACIRRINLDAFWCKRPSTVHNNALLVRRCIKMSAELGMPVAGFENPGPLPMYDHCGYGIAMMVVYDSLKPGRHSATHKQWDTVRRIRTAYSNQRRAAATANSTHLALADREGKDYRRLAQDPCAALWFANWSAGCSKRMGQDWRPDMAITPELLTSVLKGVEDRISAAENETDIIQWTLAGIYFVVCYGCSLRSTEGLLLDVEGILQHADRSPDYVIFALLGRVKGESHCRQHLLPCVNKTASGINVRSWFSRLTGLLNLLERRRGPVFVDEDLVQSTTRAMNQKFHDCLLTCWANEPELFPGAITSEADVLERYDVFRSFRRGSNSRAMSRGVSQPDRYVVNRWKSKEAARGSRPAMNMDQHYFCMEQSLPMFLRYTAEL